MKAILSLLFSGYCTLSGLSACQTTSSQTDHENQAFAAKAMQWPAKTAAADQTVHFVAFGDMGTGSAVQYAVAAALEKKCRQSGCDFAVTLGDNIYNQGVSRVDDPQFLHKFEKPYAHLPFRFYMILGNHDYRGNIEAQIAYTQHSQKWYMPDRYYTFRQGPVTFLALDTNQPDMRQQTYMKAQLKTAQTPWKIALGHHPRYTNSFYHNTQSPALKSLIDSFCGEVQLYLSGHEHDKQHLKSRCGTEYLIVGTGGGTRFSNPGPDSLFSRSTAGFAWLEASPRRLYVEILNTQGQIEHRFSLLKNHDSTLTSSEQS